MSRTTLIRTAIGALSSVLGPLALAIQHRRNAGVILLYHRIAPDQDPAYPPLSCKEFIAHCEFIRHHYRVLSLAEFLERVKNRRSLAECCAICFDDGYRDFIEYAHPILRSFNYPVTHFLVSSCVDTNVPPWTYRLNRLGAYAGVRLKDVLPGLRLMSAAEREAWLKEREVATPALPPTPPMITAKDLESFNAIDVEWGSHTKSHTFLDSASHNDVEIELRDSKQRLELILGSAVRYLAYPNGFYNQQVMQTSCSVGYEAALTVGQAEVSWNTPMHAIPRFSVGGIPSRMLPLEVTGVIERMRKLRAR